MTSIEDYTASDRPYSRLDSNNQLGHTIIHSVLRLLISDLVSYPNHTGHKTSDGPFLQNRAHRVKSLDVTVDRRNSYTSLKSLPIRDRKQSGENDMVSGFPCLHCEYASRSTELSPHAPLEPSPHSSRGGARMVSCTDCCPLHPAK